MKFERANNPEDLNKKVLEAQETILKGGRAALEAHFVLNKLAENADDFRLGFEKANKRRKTLELNTIDTRKIDIEKRKKKELELMIENKAVQITRDDFDFELIGAPATFDTTAYQNKDKQNDIRFFYQPTFDGDDNNLIKSFALIARPSGKVIYAYRIGNLITSGGRSNSFFGMSLEFNGIYCTDFETIENFFDTIFEKLIVERYNLLGKNYNTKYPYKFNINTFDTPEVRRDLEEIKAILYRNFTKKEILGCDFRKIDENFRKFIGEKHNLHMILTTKDKEVIERKDFSSNYFDFDRNEIEEKYNNELQNLKKLDIK